jgi:hypothetical protein
MPLKLPSLDEALEEMTDLALADEQSQRLARARELLRDADPHELRQKVQDRTVRAPWLVAVPLRSLDAFFAPPDCPWNYTVVAADGSTMPPDRHSPVRYYVINTGHAVLTYGDSGNAVPMPVRVQTRPYDQIFYQTVGRGSRAEELPEVSISDICGE